MVNRSRRMSRRLPRLEDLVLEAADSIRRQRVKDVMEEARELLQPRFDASSEKELEIRLDVAMAVFLALQSHHYAESVAEEMAYKAAMSLEVA